MNENPAELLNLDEQPSSAQGTSGWWWLASVVLLVTFTLLGILVALGLPRNESDWFGARYIVAIGGGLLLGSLCCIACAAIAVVRHERQSVWAVIVALPCLGLWLCVAAEPVRNAITRAETRRSAALAEQFRERLRADPEVALREKWQQASKNYTAYGVFRASFDDARVRYTPELLQRIYDEAPEMRDYLFRHPACSREFLAAHFPAAFEYNPKTFSYVQLASLVGNTNTPLELVEKVAAAKHLPVGATEAAKLALEKRGLRAAR